MGRNKGCEKTGGRQKGTPNKVTTDLKEWVKNLIDDNRTQIIKDLKNLDPRDRVAIIERLLKYVLPTGMQINQTIEGGVAVDLLQRIELQEPKLAEWIKGKYLNDPDYLIIGFENYADYCDKGRDFAISLKR